MRAGFPCRQRACQRASQIFAPFPTQLQYHFKLFLFLISDIYILASTIFLAAVAYLLFFIPEIKSKQAAESYPYNVSDEWFDMPMETTKSFYSLEPNKKKRNIFVDFFDPTSAYDCFEVVFRKREFNGRLLLILFVILSLLISAPSEYLFPL